MWQRHKTESVRLEARSARTSSKGRPFTADIHTAGRIALSNACCENREVETIPGAGRRDSPLKYGADAPITSLNVVTGPPAWRVK